MPAAICAMGLLAASDLQLLLVPVLLSASAIAAIVFVRMQRARASRLVGADVSAIVHALDRMGRGVFDSAETRVRTPAGEQIGSALQSMADGIRNQIETLQNAAHRDPLTGMANRAHFRRTVERRLDQRAPGELCCLMFIDIDGFKGVNDTLGHNLGDRLLQCIAERLKIATRLDQCPAEDARAAEDDVKMARFGGDEFVIFMSGLATETPAHKVAHRILRVIGEPFELSAHIAGVGASIGLAFVPEDAVGYSDLLRAADTAMYHAKRTGRNRVERFSTRLKAQLDRQMALERDLGEALAKGEFELEYQPLYDCRTLKISSAEALIRWRHPRHGLVSPAEFIPLAEKSDLICDIGGWVVREAARTIARFERRGRQLRISVNVSPRQLEHLEFVSLVKASLLRSNATPRLLEVEVTEGVAMRDPRMAADRLNRLAELGVSVAIDDFGTGYSSLASLISLPVSRLKLDRSLLEDLITRPEARTLVQTIISMANGLGFHAVAEGVENGEQLALLSDMGCDVVQGYYMSRPIDEAALARLVFDSGEGDALQPAFIKLAS